MQPFKIGEQKCLLLMVCDGERPMARARPTAPVPAAPAARARRWCFRCFLCVAAAICTRPPSNAQATGAPSARSSSRPSSSRRLSRTSRPTFPTGSRRRVRGAAVRRPRPGNVARLSPGPRPASVLPLRRCLHWRPRARTRVRALHRAPAGAHVAHVAALTLRPRVPQRWRTTRRTCAAPSSRA